MAGTHIKQSDDHDLAWGWQAIGERGMNRDARAAEYLAKKYPDLPIGYVGNRPVANIPELQAALLRRRKEAA